jgi:hypothetical protein
MCMTTQPQTINLHTAPPAEFDAHLADLHSRLMTTANRLHSYAETAAEILGHPWRSGRRGWQHPISPDEALDQALALDRSEIPPQHDMTWKPDQVRATRTTRFGILADIAEADKVFRQRGGWTRFFLVTSSDGHIHNSTSCSTCRPSTTYSWLPELSGLTEADAVTARGMILCSVCFPSAPVEWTVGRTKPAKPGQCAGGTAVDGSTFDRWTGTYGTCPTCGEQALMVKLDGTMRAHKDKRNSDKG